MKTILSTLLLFTVSNLSAQTIWRVGYLHPKGASYSTANCTTSTVQGGKAVLNSTSSPALWKGSEASFKGLGRPPYYSSGEVFAVNGIYQFGFRNVGGQELATAWKSDSRSRIDYPPGLDQAQRSVIRAAKGGVTAGAVWYLNGNGESSAVIWPRANYLLNRNPPGATQSAIYAMTGIELLAGSARFDSPSRAMLWVGANPTFVAVHPVGANSSEILATTGAQHAGYTETEGIRHAALWNGNTPESVVDLHPPDMGESVLTGITRDVQVGYVDSPFPAVRHARLWRGGATSFVDLHAYLRPGYTSSSATGVWADKSRIFVSGNAYNSYTNRTEAILWKWDPEASPVLNLSGSRLRTITGPNYALRGGATDINGNLKGVEVKVAGGKYQRARGTEKWSFNLRGVPTGLTRVFIRAVDKAGKTSRPVLITIRRR